MTLGIVRPQWGLLLIGSDPHRYLSAEVLRGFAVFKTITLVDSAEAISRVGRGEKKFWESFDNVRFEVLEVEDEDGFEGDEEEDGFEGAEGEEQDQDES